MTTTVEMQKRHAKTWTGMSVRAELVARGVSQERLRKVEKRIGKSLSNFYNVGVATDICSRETRPIYVEVDDDPSTPALYYLGHEEIENKKFHTYEELRAGAN